MGSEENKETADGHEQTDETKNGEKKPVWWERPWWFKEPLPIDRFTGWIVIWTYLLFVATVGLGIVAYMQWRELRDTDKTLRDTLVSTQRAWVAPSDVAIASPVAGQPVSFSLKFQNTGREPALDLYSHFVAFGDTTDTNGADGAHQRIVDEMNSCLRIDRDETTAGVIFPNQIIYQEGISFSHFLATDDTLKGHETVFLLTCFTYRSFGIIRHSANYYFYRGGKTKPETLSICDTGNNAD